MADWYIKRGEKVRGPFSSQHLKQLASKAQINPEELIGKTKQGPFQQAAKHQWLFPGEFGFEERTYAELAGIPEPVPAPKLPITKRALTEEETLTPRQRELKIGVLVCGVALYIGTIIVICILGWMAYNLYFPTPEQLEYRQGASADNRIGYRLGKGLVRYCTLPALLGFLGCFQLIRFKTYYFAWIGVICATGILFISCYFSILVPFGLVAMFLLCLPDVRRMFQ